MLAQGPEMADAPRVPGSTEGKPPRNVGSRRIFPALFKLQVLDAYRMDPDCKGNQRATARKFNIHRRQIQKWLQCEGSLRSSVRDALRYDAGQSSELEAGPDTGCPVPRLEPRLPEPASRVFKHDARTLKLVAQKLYPSSFSGAMLKGDLKGEVIKTAPGRFVPKEYQLNDTRSDAIGARPVDVGVGCYKFNMDGAAGSLILKDSVSGLNLCSPRSQSKSPVQKYCTRPEEPSGLLPRPAPNVFPPRPMPIFNPLCSPYNEEPYNLVKSPVARVCSVTPPSSSPGPVAVGAVAAATSPLPARVAEIVANSKTSAFSPKRKWLNSLQENPPDTGPHPLLPPKQRVKQAAIDKPKPKKPCPDFSIERLCGSPVTKIKTEVQSPPRQSSPMAFTADYLPPLAFPPPLLMPHRSIPDLVSLHFKPEPCSLSPEPCQLSPLTVKEEALSDEEVDVLSTSPLENKSFDFSEFSGGKRRSYSKGFKRRVLDSFHNVCNKNQRATARKYNINRRQVQKWLSQEAELRNEQCHKPFEPLPGCAGCPQHCTVSLQPCSEQACLLSDLPAELCRWAHPSALAVSHSYPNFMPWINTYDVPRIY